MTPVGALSPIPSTSREVYVRPLNKDLFPEWDMTTTMMMMMMMIPSKRRHIRTVDKMSICYLVPTGGVFSIHNKGTARMAKYS